MRLITQTCGSRPEAPVSWRGCSSGGLEYMRALLSSGCHEPSTALSLHLPVSLPCAAAPMGGAEWSQHLPLRSHLLWHAQEGGQGLSFAYRWREEKKNHDSGEKSVIQGAHSFSSVLPTGMGVSLVPLSSLPSSVPCQQSQTSHQEPLQLINHLSRVGRTDKNFHFSSLPCRLARHSGVLC